MRQQLIKACLISVFILVGCEKPIEVNKRPEKELIVFAYAGDLSPSVLDRFTNTQQEADLLTVVELTENGPRKVGSRSKVHRWTAREQQKQAVDLGRNAIVDFLKQTKDDVRNRRLDLPAIFRCASEIRKPGAKLDVLVCCAPIHSVEGAFDCSDGSWVSDGFLKAPGTPFSQQNENLNDAVFWFCPPSWGWGTNDEHEQAWIRICQLLAAKSGAKLGGVSPDYESLDFHMERGEMLHEAATMSADDALRLYKSKKWQRLPAIEGEAVQVAEEESSGSVRPIAAVLPDWVDEVFKSAEDSGRSCVAICWRSPRQTVSPIDVDLYAIRSDGERIFFAETEKPFGRLSRDVRSSNTSSSDTVDQQTWEVLEVDGPLQSYEWCINNFFSGEGAAILNLTVISRDGITKKFAKNSFDWTTKADAGKEYFSRGASESWRPLTEVRSGT
jgi:hypothetical protein